MTEYARPFHPWVLAQPCVAQGQEPRVLPRSFRRWGRSRLHVQPVDCPSFSGGGPTFGSIVLGRV